MMDSPLFGYGQAKCSALSGYNFVVCHDMLFRYLRHVSCHPVAGTTGPRGNRALPGAGAAMEQVPDAWIGFCDSLLAGNPAFLSYEESGDTVTRAMIPV